MHTKTLIEAIAQIKSKDYKVRFKMLREIFAVYDIRFNRLNVLSHFENVPAVFEWANETTDNNSFKYNGTIFRPKTLADFISIVDSLGLDLFPRFSEKFNAPSAIFWNNNRDLEQL